MARILVLFYSRNGATLALARQVCRGIESVAGATAVLRTVPAVVTVADGPAQPVPASGPAYATAEDLAGADGLVLAARRASAIWPHRSSIFWMGRARCGRAADWPAGRRRFHVHSVPPRRSGNDASEHDAATAAPRHDPGRIAVHGRGLAPDTLRWHALWRHPCQWPSKRHTEHRGDASCPGARTGAWRRSHQDWVRASRTERMNGSVSRRCATSAALSRVSSSRYKVPISRA